jgi:hypothetical protein
VECVDANFGFSRYAERLGRSANSLTNCMGVATRTNVYRSLLSILKENRNDKTYFLISVPFLGILYSAFRSAQWIKTITLKLKLQWEAVFLTQNYSIRRARF